MENQINNDNMICGKINEVYKTKIEKAIYKEFGIHTNIIAKSVKSSFVNIECTDEDVNNKMRGNKFLRKLFSNVTLTNKAWYIKEDDYEAITIFFRISYQHPNGGSNGRALGRFIIDMKKNKIEYFPF